MKHSPDYEIQLTGGEKIPLLFNTWTFKNFTRLKGIEYEDFLELVQRGQGFKGNDLPDLFFLAAQSYFRFNDVTFPYTDLEAYAWVDELGGMNSVKLIEVYKIFFGKVSGLTVPQVEELWKKAGEHAQTEETEKKKDSHGVISTSTLQPQG
jgi:hypothetical protein